MRVVFGLLPWVLHAAAGLTIMTILTTDPETHGFEYPALGPSPKQRQNSAKSSTRRRRADRQTVTRHGRSAVVVVSVAEWERTTRRAGNLAEFFAASPLRGSGLAIERRKDKPRPVDL